MALRREHGRKPMGVPKRRTSKSRIQKRVRSHKHKTPATQKCAKCGAIKQPHRVCKACGFYGKRQVLTVNADE